MLTTAVCDPWRLQTSFLETRGGGALSLADADTSGWHDAQVPGTVLLSLVKDGTYPDPRIWPNAFRVPDSSDVFNADHDLSRFSHLPEGRNPWRDPWWHRTEFHLAALPEAGRVWLTLNCLNYRAEVWVNGVCVAGPEQLVGMFRRFRLDITAAAQAGRNALAILIHPVDHPGDPDTQLEVYGPVRNFIKDICKDITEVMTIGYDCFPTVPDRNMGLVQEVEIQVTGPVDLRDPFVKTELDLPGLDCARLTVSAELVNASDAGISGVLEGAVFSPDGQLVARFSRPATLMSHEMKLITLAPTDAPELALQSPQLWWPNTYGDQPLYELRLEFQVKGEASSRIAAPFGIRRLDWELHRLDDADGLRLLVNGQRIFQRGGYIQPEMMFDWSPERVDSELRYLAEANQNYVVFEDIPNPPDWFLDLCDKHGLMFWTCFYDCYWLQYNRPWDVDRAVLEACTVDIARRYRNHPCLIIHMSQNEGETCEDIYEMWRRTVLAHDDTRRLVPSGSFPWYRRDVPDWFSRELPVGCNDYMPKTYGWQLPAAYYTLVREQRNWMFMIESGAASVPPLESLLRFMPHLAELGPNPGDDPVWPLDEAWAHYGANGYFEWFDRGLRLLYGEPKDLADYVWKAHLVTYDQHRGFYEAVHHRMWQITSGFGEWKINSGFPDVQWQFYDWFLRPMVSLFAVRKACAAFAVQLCPLDNRVSIINSTFADAPGLHLRAVMLDLDLNVLREESATVDAPANSALESFAFTLPPSFAEVPVYFVKLELWGADGALVADNFYWLSPRQDDYEQVYTGDMLKMPANKPLYLPRNTPCFPELADMPRVSLSAEALRDETSEGEARVTVSVSNPESALAFFIRVRLVDAASGEEALPVFWTDNYFSLLPGESRELTASLPHPPPGALEVAVDGWNIDPGRFVIKPQ